MAVISLESHHYHSVATATITTTTTKPASPNHHKNPAISKRKRQSNNHNKSAIDCGELSDSSSSSLSSRSTQSQRRQRSSQQQQRRSNNNNKNGRRPTKKSNTKKATPKSAPPMTAEQEAQFWALDCEMVGVGDYGGIDSILARVVIVDWHGQVVLDQYVQPTQPVTDYRMHVSGITADQLLAENGAVPWQTCHDTILELLHISTSLDSDGWLDYSQTTQILVGHGLKNDLAVLGLPGYPWYLQRDTTKWEPFLQSTNTTATACRLPGSPRKLRDLTKCKLHRDIQAPGRPHCPHEDAVAALDLYKLVRVKWEKAMDYKLNKTREIMLLQQQQQQRAPQEAQEATAQERPHETRVDDKDKGPCDAVPLLQHKR